MKKNLLSLTACLIGITAYTQTSDTYINDNVTVKVNPNTLFYHGGNVTIESATNTDTEKIINEGNIQIVGNFSNNNTTGSNFVNKYIDDKNYGQLIINENSNATGKIAIERANPLNPNDSYQGNEYPISLPFNNSSNNIADIINSVSGDIFQGECPIDFNCGQKRYDQTVFEWNISKSVFDATVPSTKINPLSSYLINLTTNTKLKNTLNQLSNNPLVFKGIPNNKSTANFIAETSIQKRGDSSPLTKTQFNGEWFGRWKNYLNQYNETYDSYLGTRNADGSLNSSQNNSYLFGKNLHRFGNPYTSNLDLSDIDKWLTFIVQGTPQKATFTNANVTNFRISKPGTGYKIDWVSQEGSSTSGSNTIFSASLDRSSNDNSYTWVGSAQALLIKPYETFYIYYPSINTTTNGSRIITAQINLSDNQKTFNQSYPLNSNNTPIQGARNLSINNQISQSSSTDKITALRKDSDLINKGLVNNSNFTQLEIFLTRNNSIIGNAIYLANAGNFNERANNNSNNSIYITNPVSGKNLELNTFNSREYIAQPFKLGFENLKNGESYSLLLNLYEFSILNQVNKLETGKYFLYDEQTKKYIDISSDVSVTFTFDDKTNDRYTIYWQEKPKSSSPIIEDEIKEEEVRSQSTDIYKNNTNQYIRFENSNTTAKIEVFDLLGRLVSSKSNINTSSDYKLNLNSNIYIVVITYADGKVVTKKSIN